MRLQTVRSARAMTETALNVVSFLSLGFFLGMRHATDADRQFLAEGSRGEGRQERSIAGAPVDVLLELVEEVNADLLVVGNVGVNSIAGRLLGSVPAAVRRRAKTKVLVADTAD